MKCKHCGKEIYLAAEQWFHTEDKSNRCAIVAEPDTCPAYNPYYYGVSCVLIEGHPGKHLHTHEWEGETT